MEAAVRAGGVTPMFPARALTWETKGRAMSEAEHEHDEGDEAVSAPVSVEEESEALAEEEDAEAAETAAHEPADVPAAQGATQEEWERRFTRSERAFATYTKKVSEIYSDDAIDLLPVSISPSAPPGFIYRHDAGHVPDDVQAPIMEFFGLAREREYRADPETETCSACDGEGKTQTGSKVPNHQTRPCPRCLGWGYTRNGAAPTATAAVGNGELHDAAEQVGPLVTDERDAWGEPKILPDGRVNPNYGKMPQFKELIEPWGMTAGLGAQDAVANA